MRQYLFVIIFLSCCCKFMKNKSNKLPDHSPCCLYPNCAQFGIIYICLFMHKLTFKEMPVKGQLSDNQLLLSFKNSCYFEFFSLHLKTDHVLCLNDSWVVINFFFEKCAFNPVALNVLQNIFLRIVLNKTRYDGIRDLYSIEDYIEKL